MKTFHIDEPSEIGKKRLKISPKDKKDLKKGLTEVVVKKKLRELIRKELRVSK